jgi:hypothetical protein
VPTLWPTDTSKVNCVRNCLIKCQHAIRSIENYSRILSSGEPVSRGANFVRLRVKNALASFRSKLKAIEAGQPAVLS